MDKGKQFPRLLLHCPVCGNPARVRTSRPMSETTRDLYMECGNDKCRTIFKAIVEATEILAPSLLSADEQLSAGRNLRRSLRCRREVPIPVDPRQLNLLAPIPDT